MTFDEMCQIPIPDKTYEPARRHCYEVAREMLYMAENGYAVGAIELQSFAARLLDGVALKYGGTVTR